MAINAPQALVDGFAAVGLLAFSAALLGSRGKGPVEGRLAFLFLAAGLFYAIRAGFHATAIIGFERASLFLASLLPLGALLVTETLLRRHAPRALKIVMAAGAALGLAGAIGMPAEDLGRKAFGATFMAYVLGGLAASFCLLLFRSRPTLSAQENATIDAVSRGIGALAILSATDFGIAGPIGLSGLGALAVAYSISIGAYGHRRWRVMLEVVLTISLFAAATSLGLTVVEDAGWFVTAAIVAVAMSALTLVLRLRAAPGEGRRRDFLRTLATAGGGGLGDFLQAVADEPLLKGLVVMEGAALDGYDRAPLAALFEVAPVWSRQDLKALTGRSDAEQAMDMLLQHEAAYAVLLSPSPLRIGLVASGPGGRVEDDKVELLIFHRLAMMASERKDP